MCLIITKGRQHSLNIAPGKYIIQMDIIGYALKTYKSLTFSSFMFNTVNNKSVKTQGFMHYLC